MSIIVFEFRAYIEFERTRATDSHTVLPAVYKAIKMR